MASCNGRRTRHKKSNIKDYMDGILESKHFYRKHVANDGNSLFRAISDGIFGTQRYKHIVAKATELLLNDTDKDFSEYHNEEYKEPNFDLVCQLAKRFNFNVEIVSSIDKEMKPFGFSPIRNRSKRQHDQLPKVLLCFTPPRQYDPIYPKNSIEIAGMCQSILYEMLYSHVFGMVDAMTAADLMLNGEFESGKKPDILVEAEYEGSAIEALHQNLIPFPYKVAKCLDPASYRNIEYDVWTCERQELYVQQLRAAEDQLQLQTTRQRSSRLHIGNLERGSPCVLRFPQFGSLVGYVQGPCADRQKIEVFVPLYDQCVYVERSAVLPIKEAPKELRLLPRWPDERPRLYEPQVAYNLMGNWVVEERRIPPTPPPLPSPVMHCPMLDHQAFPPLPGPPPSPLLASPPVQQDERHPRVRPPPLNIIQNETMEYEHYAGCYSCQVHESTPNSCLNRYPPIPQLSQYVLPCVSPQGTPNPPIHSGHRYVLVTPINSPYPVPLTGTPFPGGPTTPALVFQYPSPAQTAAAGPNFFVFPQHEHSGHENQE